MRAFLGVVILTLAAACAAQGDSDERALVSHSTGKVQICHIPPSNPQNAQVLEVSSSAVSSHLAHGDHTGACDSCTPGSTLACYGGPAGTDGVGACHAGTQTCTDGTGYEACAGEVTPAPEACGNAIDDDCDGAVDEGCACVPDASTLCYDGPAETVGVGTCLAGTQTCNADGSGFGDCVGAVVPVADTCADGLDNDCDGVVDETCACAPGSTEYCYAGSPDTADVGLCHSGTQTCLADGSDYGACAGEVLPTTEVCGNGLDDDCDGVADDSCVCVPESTAACYTGPAGTIGVGACEAGTQACNADGTGYDGCLGDLVPTAEVCGDNLDNNCDGATDEGCGCSPTSEVCGDAIDNDCDGSADEGCIGDRAWIDRDLDGTQGGEVGLADVGFILRTASGAVVAVTSSDSSGEYYFSGVPAGSYFVEVVAPAGMSVTTMDAGFDDVLDNDFDAESMATATFTYDGSALTTIDCGLVLASST